MSPALPDTRRASLCILIQGPASALARRHPDSTGNAAAESASDMLTVIWGISAYKCTSTSGLAVDFAKGPVQLEPQQR